ncbi:phosphatidate cytidylyltransferase [Tropicimonas sp. IMCC6043]|uniref:phosphatidate cytidylyltransferase n=1 Tax=Tropicimonas sp. IMCC6043 TaxID=2510645 RepID=UPI00101C3067|nr:phosphatidate cytidylyltransferase [Tropicimonas sp. IMCC6043]RYH10447.1 phosphatidate cytidylyltransferase [Tropicimonas sp. IMCC6043]
MQSPRRWEDLNARTWTGLAMVVIGIVAIRLGGVWFQMLVVFACSVMIWELARMIRPGWDVGAMLLAAFSASVISGLMTQSPDWHLLLLLVPATVGTSAMPRERLTFFLFAFGITVAGWGLVEARETYGGTWLFWMVICVVVTDVAGYFAGRRIGGPKFWPAVSPKKTWSGTVAGWIGAGLVGALFLTFTNAGRDTVWLSMLLSLAAQMGDIAESALKRRMGVKDSSSLIPGHGGLFDRFDGLLGASLFMLLLALIVDVPEVRI